MVGGGREALSRASRGTRLHVSGPCLDSAIPGTGICY